MTVNDFLDGSLLGDANIWKSKCGNYFYYKLTAKDKKFLEWCKKLLQKFGITNCYIVPDNKLQGTFALGFYINKYTEFLSLRNRWYKDVNGKAIKNVPKNLKLTPTVLLHWYLGDGSLIRHRKDESRVPAVVLATNKFSRKDVDFLIEKLKKLGLNFYRVKYKSGFTGKRCGYALWSSTEDGTPFRFFKLIGFECPEEIANCVTGRKGRGSKLHYFKDKWPTEEDWVRILSNVKIGKILRKRRLELGLTQNQLAKKVGVRRENIRDVELEKRNFSVRNFRKILKTLNLDIPYLLRELKVGG